MSRRMVVGLGNPGEEYRGTRHNVGFEVLARLAAALRLRWRTPGLGPRGARAEVAEDPGRDVVLVRPITYMNRSGEAVAAALSRYGVGASDALVVCDDLNLPVGRLRLRARGSAGGHHGLESILAALGTEEFPRLRVGIGSPGRDAVEYVLSPFESEERPTMERAFERAAEAARAYAEGTSVAALQERTNRVEEFERGSS